MTSTVIMIISTLPKATISWSSAAEGVSLTQILHDVQYIQTLLMRSRYLDPKMFTSIHTNIT